MRVISLRTNELCASYMADVIDYDMELFAARRIPDWLLSMDDIREAVDQW
jgi:hypothetical protein